MASINSIVRGLQILAKYSDPDDVAGPCAEHDVIYAGHGAAYVTPEDEAALQALGWHWDDGVESWARWC